MHYGQCENGEFLFHCISKKEMLCGSTFLQTVYWIKGEGDEIVRFLIRNHISDFMDGKKTGLGQETGTRDRF